VTEEPEFFAAKNENRRAMVLNDGHLARMIEHTNLRPEATEAQIVRLCQEGREFGFVTVVVNPAYVELASSELAGSEVKVAAVVGFPLGATLASVKRFEAGEVLKLGAREIDMVLNLGALKSGKREFVQSEIQSLAELTHERGGLLKVILETGLLSDDEKKLACELSVRAGADFVKTSTGFLGGGATADDVRLMRQIVGPSIGVKASGGIRTAGDAKAMVEAGANRIGTSSGVKIIEELREALPTTR
jgi:deoxyribose-phosphate aldolase